MCLFSTDMWANVDGWGAMLQAVSKVAGSSPDEVI
jgi:hypothetical protein